MDKIIARYSESEFVEVEIGGESVYVSSEDLSEVSDLLKLIGKKFNIEIKEINDF